MSWPGDPHRPSGWSFPARTTAYFIVVAALSMTLLAFMGLTEVRRINQEHSQIRVDRAARAAAALFETQQPRRGSDPYRGGSPRRINIDSIDRLEPGSDWDALLDMVAEVSQGEASIYRYNAETSAFDRIATTSTDPTGARVGGSSVEPGLISAGHPAYESVRGRRPFVGEVPVEGRMRYAYLTPLIDDASAPVGILAVVGGLVDDLDASNSIATRNVVLTVLLLLAMMAASGVTVMFFAFRPMNRLIRVAHDVGAESSHDVIGLTTRRDEIGYLASGLSKVVKLQKDLAHRAYTDDLTKVPNRASFVRELERRIADPRLHEAPAAFGFAVLLIDLDSFKEVNDAMGHQVGDELLLSVAASLAAVTEPEEFFARVGGDEFALLTAPGCVAADEVALVSLRVLQRVADVNSVRSGGARVSASIGGAIVPDDGATIREAMTSADLALYWVKRNGRAHARIYDASLSEPLHRRVHLATELRRALADREIRLDYQPLYAADDGRLRSVEALARWTHAIEGPIPPLEFVGVAENAGLIGELGQYVIDEACAQLARWRSDGAEVPVVAINVSTMQLWESDFVDFLREAMDRHGVPPDLLCLEITESVVLQQDPLDSRSPLDEISALGVRLSIDDFGTGYSSLSYLHDLPVQQLKIDRLFLAGASNDVKQRQLFAGIVALGRKLGLEIVAEGVETSVELDFVRRHGCDLVQGWFLDPALPVDTVSTRFRSVAAPWASTSIPAAR